MRLFAKKSRPREGYETAEGAKPLDELRPYDVAFFRDGIERYRIVCHCIGREVSQALRRLREEHLDMAVTAVPNLTADEIFIQTYGIGIH